LGSLPRLFDNKGIRHGKTGRTPSLRDAQRRGNPESFNAAAKPLEILPGGATRQSGRRSGFLKRQGVLTCHDPGHFLAYHDGLTAIWYEIFL
jgi:hypothetical protein